MPRLLTSVVAVRAYESCSRQKQKAKRNTFLDPQSKTKHPRIESINMASPSDPLLHEHTGPRSLRQRPIYLPEEQGQRIIAQWRRAARDFLSSRRGHYLVLLLVSVDVACTFADFLIELHVCELTKHGSHVAIGWGVTQKVLAIVGLVFSCLFMLELMVTVFSFGKG